MINCRGEDYSFVRGDTFTLNVQYESSDGGCPPVLAPIPITGAAIYFTCKRYANDPDVAALFQLTVGSGITISDGANGKFTVIIPTADTESLAADVPYFYDCVIEPPGGGRDTVLKGALVLQANITDV